MFTNSYAHSHCAGNINEELEVTLGKQRVVKRASPTKKTSKFIKSNFCAGQANSFITRFVLQGCEMDTFDSYVPDPSPLSPFQKSAYYPGWVSYHSSVVSISIFYQGVHSLLISLFSGYPQPNTL